MQNIHLEDPYIKDGKIGIVLNESGCMTIMDYQRWYPLLPFDREIIEIALKNKIDRESSNIDTLKKIIKEKYPKAWFHVDDLKVRFVNPEEIFVIDMSIHDSEEFLLESSEDCFFKVSI